MMRIDAGAVLFIAYILGGIGGHRMCHGSVLVGEGGRCHFMN